MVISGFRGETYAADIAGQQAQLLPLVAPIVDLVLGPGIEYEIIPRRGVLRNSILPPCEVDFRTHVIATRFRTEAARLSRAKHEGLSHIYFNPCLTLATRSSNFSFVCYIYFIPVLKSLFCVTGSGLRYSRRWQIA